ncbi:protein dispatched homolog 1 [Colossoma macropomum]|uniref:protein dispatched homolog 1 n=1 Tax=Colossoma macropomum TaxID=42526 RepID=UPI0018644841|nr:protein dispatched homolog 1 [Colossoma macropomum]XP_036438135.1 protein dispatched homolog 1 [Colossoma macropomum]XP_036438136.1 protein dispatched homolog 1 [Colossoma macropomum]
MSGTSNSGQSMALNETSSDELPLSSGGDPPSTTASSILMSSVNFPSSAAAAAALDTNEEVEQGPTLSNTGPRQPKEPSLPSQNSGTKQNGSIQPHSSSMSSSSSAPLSHLTDSQRLTKLLPSSIPPPCCVHCPFHESVCCSGTQQEGSLYQGPLPSRSLHMGSLGSCCMQGAPTFCRHHHRWQEHFQNPPNMATLSPARPFRFPKSYAELISDWPVVVLGVCTVLIVVCTLVGILVPDLPDFSDPLLGFEPRGTAIGQRLVTWNNMVKNTGYKATLANYPFKYADEQAKSHQEDRWSEDHYERDKRQAEWDFSKDSFFCDVPGESYSRIVFASAEGKNLWNIQAIKSMCNFDNTRVRSHPQYWNLCQRTTAASCCPSWTLGNYIAVLTNKSSCQKITERDVSHTLKVLRSCAKYYYNGTLGPECWDMNTRRKDQLKCASVPRKCTKYNAVYQILHFLVDKDFLNPKSPDFLPPTLTYSMLFSPTEKGESMMNIYLDNFENWNSSDGVTTVTGIEFGIKHNLFQEYLLTDTMYPAIAIVIVLAVMCVYTKSVFITIMTMFAIISSLVVSYVLYRVVFNFEFFPFMNLTALIILVGIGADDAFVLCDVWNYTKMDKPNSELSETVNVTLQHAALSMFVTSFTTAAAFYANYVSNITAIRCFGVYAGTAILVNYVLMITWLPAVVVLHERYLLNLFICFRPPHQTSRVTSFLTSLCQKASNCMFAISETSRIFFEKVLPCIVIKLRYLWLFWFLAITVGGAYIVCVNPKMKLPSLELSEFQVFRSTHPFERYDAEYKKLFMFERVHHGEDLYMPITIIWGVTPVDSGDPLNPKNKGKLTLDTSFNIASPASQAWILNFCQRLRNQSFVFQSDEQDFTSCFMETFKQWMENQDCDEARVYPCCSQSTFPYKQDVFELCIKRAIMELDRSTIYHLDSKTPGPRFDINDTIRAIVLEFQSTYHFTLAYEKMHQFYREVDAWIQEELKNAPEGLSYGWFVSNLEFYDLQDSLSDGTLIAMALSVLVAFSVMLLTTWNIIISLYAIISIAGTIFVTVGSLVLLGWELNVLESVTISVAVGLSVDFAVHYGVAYRLAPEPDREGKVVFSLSRMGSAIAMAALTTFVAGAMMMPSTVLAYTQLGTFLMLIMCISWAFATFFFQCMCRCLGPQGTCGQIPMPKTFKCHAFEVDTSDTPSSQGQGKHCQLSKYHSDTRGLEVEYELEPLATSVTNMEKIEDQEACIQLPNGNVSYHAACFQIKGKSDSERENSGPDNGIPSIDPAHLRQYAYNASNCGDSLSRHILSTQRTLHQPCIRARESPCLASQYGLASNHVAKGQSILSTLDTVHMTTNHDMNYVQCASAHFHLSSQAQTPRPGPIKSHGCYLSGYGMHTLHLQPQAQPPDDSGLDGSLLNNPCNPSLSPPEGPLALSNSAAHNQMPPVQCCNSPQTPRICVTNNETQSGDKIVNPQVFQNIARNHIKTNVKNDTSVFVQGNYEKFKIAPTMLDRSVQCKQYHKNTNENTDSSKQLKYFNRTIKLKCNSAEFHKPKTEANVPVLAISSHPSSESLC